MKISTKLLLALVIIFCNVSCDQISKEKVRTEISTNERIHIIGNNFILTKVENTGAALSTGANLSPTLKKLFLQLLPFLVIGFLFIYIIRSNKISKLSLVGFSFIIGGGIGNLYDRVLYESVTDFMFLQYGSLHTGIFNMADLSIVIGCIMIIIGGMIKPKETVLETVSIN